MTIVLAPTAPVPLTRPDLVVGALDAPNDRLTRARAAGGTLSRDQQLRFAALPDYLDSLAGPGDISLALAFCSLRNFSPAVDEVLSAAMRAGLHTCWRRDGDIDQDLLDTLEELFPRIAHLVLLSHDGGYADMCERLLDNGAAVTIVGIPWQMSQRLKAIGDRPRGRVLSYNDIPGLCTYEVVTATLRDVPEHGVRWFAAPGRTFVLDGGDAK
jgi:hypothetical protein